LKISQDKLMVNANQGSSRLCVIDFSASWCGPCKMIGPIYEGLPKSYPRVLFAKADVDEADVRAVANSS
jgi:thioredoxin 1